MEDIHNLDKKLNNAHLLFKHVLDLEKQAIHLQHQQCLNHALSKRNCVFQSKWQYIHTNNNTNTKQDISTKQDSFSSVIIHNNNNCTNLYQNVFNNDIDFSKPKAKASNTSNQNLSRKASSNSSTANHQ